MSNCQMRLAVHSAKFGKRLTADLWGNSFAAASDTLQPHLGEVRDHVMLDDDCSRWCRVIFVFSRLQANSGISTRPRFENGLNRYLGGFGQLSYSFSARLLDMPHSLAHS